MTLAAHVSIDLTAVKHNLDKVRQLAPAAKILAVIKANAYGHGMVRVAEALDGIDAVAVARITEGIYLRNTGCVKKIVVLEGFVDESELLNLIDSDLEFVVHSEGQVDIIEKYNGAQQISLWLKLDTGMNRLGLKAVVFSSVYQRLMLCNHIKKPLSLMTHFSSADDRNDKSVTERQLALFTETVKDYPGSKSLANSAAIIDWPRSIADWVRPGLMLYGVSPFLTDSAEQLGLVPVMSFHSRLISVKVIEAGETVGYSGTWVATGKTRLGVIAIGYGDGYPRYAEIGTPVLVNGIRVPLVGRVSMDMITVDLGEMDVVPGAQVTLWGDGLPVEEIAKYSKTIPYTLLCGITQRVKVTVVS